MKRVAVLCVGILVLALVPTWVCAQGLLPGLPAFGGGPGAYGQPGPRLFEPLTFYVGWMESLRRAGWSFADPNPGGLFGGKHNFDVAGLWLGLEQKINLTETCGVDLDGWVLIPSNRRGSEVEASSIVVGQPPTTTTISVPGGRTFNTRSEWWYLDAAATCSFCTPFKAIAGFRYEHFSVRFDNPSDAFGLVVSPDAEADLTINGYLPFVGLQAIAGGPASNVCVRFIGFPWAPGDVTHSETGVAGLGLGSRIDSTRSWNNSYFMEIFAEYNRNFAAGMGIGAFFRWNLLHGQTDLSATLPSGLAVSSDASFDRNTMTFGGSFNLSFNTPL